MEITELHNNKVEKTFVLVALIQSSLLPGKSCSIWKHDLISLGRFQ